MQKKIIQKPIILDLDCVELLEINLLMCVMKKAQPAIDFNRLRDLNYQHYLIFIFLIEEKYIVLGKKIDGIGAYQSRNKPNELPKNIKYPAYTWAVSRKYYRDRPRVISGEYALDNQKVHTMNFTQPDELPREMIVDLY